MRDLSYIPTAYSCQEAWDRKNEEHPSKLATRNLEFIRGHAGITFAAPTHLPSDPWLAEELKRLVAWVIEYEDVFRDHEQPSWNANPDHLSAFETWTKNRRHLLTSTGVLMRGLTDVMLTVLDEMAPIQKMRSTGDSLFNVPAYMLLPDVAAIIDRIYQLFTNFRFRATPTGMFERLQRTLTENHYNAERQLNISGSNKRPFQLELSPKGFVETYLKGTPFLDLFVQPVPIEWTQITRQRHTHVIGGSGAGKTTLLKNLVEFDLFENPDKPSLVVIDPGGGVVEWAADIQTDRDVILIDAGDVNYPPAINPLAINQEAWRTATAQQRSRMENDVIDTLSYVIGALDMEITGSQQLLLNHLGELLLSYPSIKGRPGKIGDLVRFLSDPESERETIEQIPDEETRCFLMRELFVQKGGRDSLAQTKDAVRTRLSAIVSRRNLRRLFNAPDTLVDWYSELNRGTMILVNTAEPVLGTAGSSLFGRMVIGQIMQALKLRHPAIPEPRRYPVYMYVDEAQNFFSDRTDTVLEDFRKLGCGAIFAHHSLGQRGLTDVLRAALLTNTATKFAADLGEDSKRMAGLMKTDAKFIDSLPLHTFAVNIGGVTPHAVQLKTHLPRRPHKTVVQREVFKWRNRDRVSTGSPPSTPPESDDNEWV